VSFLNIELGRIDCLLRHRMRTPQPVKINFGRQ